jgi:hypothetical protein
VNETPEQLRERLPHFQGRSWTWARWEPQPAERASLGPEGGTILARAGEIPDEVTAEPVADIWDHDHCEVCWARFTIFDIPNESPLREGYTLPGPAGSPESEWKPAYHWVCERCFNEHRALLGWTVTESSA